MDSGVLEALRRIAREKQLDGSLLTQALEAGLMSAARKRYGPAAEIEVLIDEESDTFGVYLTKTVVEEPSDDDVEIELEEAKELNVDVELGDMVSVEIPLDEFGRNAIQAAKQIVVQRVREAEREQIYEEFQDRIGEIVTGDVQQVEHGGIVINLGRTEAVLPAREQIRRERYRQGDRLRAYLLSVEKTTKGPQIVLSRTHPNFLKKLFRMEVPEIYDSVVEIMMIAREAGGRSKVAVVSHDERVDPVGACVGVKGSRIQTIVRELSGEKIDIVPWSQDPAMFASRALNPAKVSKTVVNETEHSVKVIVPDDQLSLAIGRGGQNARLAAKLTGWKIDIVGETEHVRQLDIDFAQRVEVGELPGVGPKLAQHLADAGYRYVQNLDGVSTEDLLRVPGVGKKTAEKIPIAVAAVLEVLEEEKQKLLKEIQAQAQAEATAAASPLDDAVSDEEGEYEEADADEESATGEAAESDEGIAEDTADDEPAGDTEEEVVDAGAEAGVVSEDPGTDEEASDEEATADEDAPDEEAAADEDAPEEGAAADEDASDEEAGTDEDAPEEGAGADQERMGNDQ